MDLSQWQFTKTSFNMSHWLKSITYIDTCIIIYFNSTWQKTKYKHFSIIRNIFLSPIFYKSNETNKIDKRLTILKIFTTRLTKQHEIKVRAVLFFYSDTIRRYVYLFVIWHFRPICVPIFMNAYVEIRSTFFPKELLSRINAIVKQLTLLCYIIIKLEIRVKGKNRINTYWFI